MEIKQIEVDYALIAARALAESCRDPILAKFAEDDIAEIIRQRDKARNRSDEQKAIGAYYDRVMPRSDNGSLDYLSEERGQMMINQKRVSIQHERIDACDTLIDHILDDIPHRDQQPILDLLVRLKTDLEDEMQDALTP